MDLLLLQRDEGIDAVWIWLAIILLPILGRIVGWVLQKLSPPQDADTSTGDVKQARRERARELEQRGREAWKRLLEGEESPRDEPVGAEPAGSSRESAPSPAPQPRAAPEPRPAAAPPRPATVVREPVSRAPRREVRRLKRDGLPSSEAVPTAERELVRSRPSEGMPAIQELEHHKKSARRAAADLRADEVGDEIARVAYLESLAGPGDEGLEAPGVLALPLPAGVDDWRLAIVWSEILAPPVSLRDPGGPGMAPGAG